jgi:hypothetical protein
MGRGDKHAAGEKDQHGEDRNYREYPAYPGLTQGLQAAEQHDNHQHQPDAI